MANKVSIGQLRRLHRLAALGFSMTDAAAALGLSKDFVWSWAPRHGVRFGDYRMRGVPLWLMPELARRAECVVRATMERVRT